MRISTEDIVVTTTMRTAPFISMKNLPDVFLTSACVEAKGLPDDCYGLTVLRKFRDTYLRFLPCGEKEIAEYYFVAPQIVSAIKKREDYLCIFDSIYTKLVKPCVNMIERGDNEKAHILYRDTIQQLRTQYLV